MQLDEMTWESLTKIHRETLSEAEKVVILDQVNLFWGDKSVPDKDSKIALNYSVALADMLYLCLFNPSADAGLAESVKTLKLLINSRWGK